MSLNLFGNFQNLLQETATKWERKKKKGKKKTDIVGMRI